MAALVWVQASGQLPVGAPHLCSSTASHSSTKAGCCKLLCYDGWRWVESYAMLSQGCALSQQLWTDCRAWLPCSEADRS